MKTQILSLAFVAALAFGARSIAAPAGLNPGGVIVLPNEPVPAPAPALGVSTRLTTSGYHFTVGSIIPPPGPPGTATPDYIAFGPVAFEASFALVNHTSSEITFQVPVSPVATGAAAARPLVTTGSGPAANPIPVIVFSVYDSQNNLVWQSWTNPGDLPTGSLVLNAGRALRLTAAIPLQVNDKFLNGDYTLVASVNGAPEFSSTTSFTVAMRPVLDPPRPAGTPVVK